MNTKRVKGLILAAVLILTAGIFISFLTSSIFARPERPIVLPSAADTALPASGGPYDFPASTPEPVLPVAVTPETVQSVVATLSRPVSYSCRITAGEYWSGGQDRFIRKIWVRNGYVRADFCSDSGEVWKCALLDGDTVFYWTPGSAQFWKGARGDESADDLQRVPTYEDLVSLPVKKIVSASYEQLNGDSCICAGVSDKDLGYDDTYWISVGNGLLTLFERYENGTLVYRAEMDSLETGEPADERFTLPNHELVWNLG